MLTLKQAIEAIVFASPKPIGTAEILAALKAAASDSEDVALQQYFSTETDEVVRLLEELRNDYVETQRAFQLADQVNGWTFVTVPDSAPWVRQLYPEAKPTRLSGPALETLAIIAYRQPVTRADIEAVRGVAVDGVMQVLLDRSLVKIAGRAEVPGRPLLYQTTEYFLQHFGLKEVDELPNVDELRRVKLPTAPVPEEPAKKEVVDQGPELPLAEAEPAPTSEEPAASEETAAPAEDAPAQDAPVEETPAEEQPPVS